MESRKLRIAIVGNRDYPNDQKWDVIDFVKSLNKDDVIIVSGGARGPDRWAQITSDRFGYETDIYPVVIGKEEVIDKKEFRNRAYSRNKEIIENCDMVVAFICKDWGGVWNTIKGAIKKGKLVLIRDSRLVANILQETKGRN